MSALKRFALIFGIVFLLAGIAGFVPGITTPHTHPDVVVTAGLGLVLGLFAVNVLHNLVHLLFGVWGLFAATSDAMARIYARTVAIAYGLVTVMGLVPQMNLHTAFGFVPVYGHDVWLHAALAIVAAYFGFMHERDLHIDTGLRPH